MIGVFKRLKFLHPFKSKISLSILAFIFGYFFHFLNSFYKMEQEEIFNGSFSSHSGKSSYNDAFLVVLIFSAVNNFNRRQTLRETWLSGISENSQVKHYFVISGGNAKKDQKLLLSIEQNKHGDLLLFPHLEDSFYFLTPKLVASFGWLTQIPTLHIQGKSQTSKPFDNFKFVLKCDDDSFVRVTEIVHELSTVFSGKKGENLYWGFFDGRAKVKKSGKYKEDEWNICDYYIPYALGGGYILAQPLVKFIAKNGDFLKKFKSEDISVGAWLATYSDINRVHDPRFDTEYISRGCHQSYLITHKHSEVTIRNFHDNLKNSGHLCQKEYRTRLSYIYNWQLVPSKCCTRNNPNVP